MNYAERRETWDRCWGAGPRVPEYFSPGELEKLTRLRDALFAKYLKEISEVSEFGCGTGHNLAPLVGAGKRLRGFDWSVNAVKIAGRFLEAQVFDMLAPDLTVKVNGAVLTVHALEQLGGAWIPFLRFLCAQKPILCIHIEPIEELYDPHDEHDARCLIYHHKRGYLVGFLSALREMAKLGEAELIEVRKSPRWGMNHDAYSVIVWRPL